MNSLLTQMLVGIAKELGEELSTLNVAPSSLETPEKTPQASSQIVQVSPLPLTLKLVDFKNAYSNVNPEGDIFAAQKFQQLVDPAPALTQEYMTSTSSIEDVYGGIVHGASAPIKSTYLTRMIANAKQNFDINSQSDFVTHGEWRLIEANPHDWYTDNADRYKTVKIPLDNDGHEASPTTLTLGDKQVPLSEATQLTHCELEYMLVRFIRPWMDFTLFKTDGWWLTGQQPGYCSSGRGDINSGILPLVTTGMILVRSAQFEGDWHPEDEKKINECSEANKDICLGPYRLSKKTESVSTVSVVAWISELVPLSP